MNNIETKCQHKKVFIIGVHQDNDEYKDNYWFNCLKCKTTGLGELKEYRQTDKLYDNSFVIYAKE